MPMSDELASASLSSAQKSLEAGLEIIKMLSPIAKKLMSGILDKAEKINLGNVGSAKGAVSQAKLILEANKANSPIITNENFLATDIDSIALKAKENAIPIHIIGAGEKQSVSFLERDKAIINQITQEIIADRLREAPQSIKSFAVSEQNVMSLKAEFVNNKVECQFIKSNNGQIFCVYPAKDAEKVGIIKDDLKNAHNDLSEKFSAVHTESGIQLEDTKLGKVFIINDDDAPLTKSRITDICHEQFGYSKAEAELAANKVCDDLKLNPQQYFKNAEQLDNINTLKTNIRYQSDSILLRDIQFSAVNFKDGNTTHIFVNNGETQATLTASKMTEQEMKNICTTQMNMTEEQASETVSKAMKINTQINSKLKETTIDKNTGLTSTIDINRTANNAFSVKVGTRQKSYNFSTINLADKISKDFGIPKDKAESILNKAKSQSVLQNKVNDLIKKTGGKSQDTAKNIGKSIKEVKKR